MCSPPGARKGNLPPCIRVCPITLREAQADGVSFLSINDFGDQIAGANAGHRLFHIGDVEAVPCECVSIRERGRWPLEIASVHRSV
jgi:hypothetical protein